jgi:hypothetical protein
LLLRRRAVHRRQRRLEPAAVGLVIANVIVIGVVVAALLVSRRAWELRENALTALDESRAHASLSVAAVARPLAPTLHAPPYKLRSTAMDRILLIGILGAAGSVYFTWLVVRRERAALRASRSRQRSSSS